MTIIDCHVYAFPSPKWVASAPAALNSVRAGIRQWLRPFSSSLHIAQTYVRYLPDSPRRAIEQLGLLAPVPSLLVESTSGDLKAAMAESEITRALVVAHPPVIENEFVLDLAQEDPSLIPVVAFPPGTRRPADALRRAVGKGARALKLHPSADGEDADCPRYHTLLKTAADLGLPVFLHTGRFQIPFVLKSPELGDAQRFVRWFKEYPDIRFVLAHMNYSQPHIALDLAEEYANLFVEISWQPSELIEEAVRRIGAERVLFGTDWPLMGGNMSVGVKRVRTCIEDGSIDEEQARLIFGKNAEKLLGLA